MNSQFNNYAQQAGISPAEQINVFAFDASQFQTEEEWIKRNIMARIAYLLGILHNDLVHVGIEVSDLHKKIHEELTSLLGRL